MPSLNILLVRWLYNIIFILSLPLLCLRLLFRSCKNPEYRKRIFERFGIFSYPLTKPSIWIHAVSVGEVNAASKLIFSLQQEFKNHEIVVTTTTPTGSKQLKQLFKNNSLFHVYFPFDISLCWNQFFKRIKPSLCIIMETEIWPNLLNKLNQKKIPTILANACLSEKSYRGYQKIKFFISSILKNINYVACQTEKDANYFLNLGINKDKIKILGNLKFDSSLNLQKGNIQKINHGNKIQNAKRKIWIAASTHQGEETLLLNVHKELLTEFSDLLFILVPRHPERFESVAKDIQKCNLNFRRRTEIINLNTSNLSHSVNFSDFSNFSDIEVLLINTMGELPLFYSISDIAFVGGSFVNIGGHNILEPAALDVPMIVGPYTQNIEDTLTLFKNKNAIIQIYNETELINSLKILLQDENKNMTMKQSAKQIILENQGACEKTLALIKKLIT